MSERVVNYFNKPGPANTRKTIAAVQSCLDDTDSISALIVGSVSGGTALRIRKELGETSVPIVCVTAPPGWQIYPQMKSRWMTKKTKTQLEKSGVVVVDSVPCMGSSLEWSFGRYGFRSPTWIFIETLLAVGGYGLKTAVECIFMATDGGYISPYKEVLSVAGTDKGIDTAIVARSTFSSTAFSSDSHKRFIVNEILAMPRNKVYYKGITVGEWNIEEVK